MNLRRIVIMMALALVASLGVTLVAPLTSSTPPEAQAALRKAVNTDYTLLRRGPHSYVTGTAYRGWTVDVQQDASSGYRWGRVFGDLNMCIWIFEGAVTGSGAASDSCPSTNREMPESEFTNGQIGGGADDGANVATVAGPGCTTYNGVNLTG